MLLIATKMTVTSMFRMCCHKRGSSDVSVYIIEVVHEKVIVSVSISSSLIQFYSVCSTTTQCMFLISSKSC